MEEEKEERVDVEGEETQEEVTEEADEGEMLVLRGALSSQRSEKEEQKERTSSHPMYYSGKSMFMNHRWRKLC